MRPRDALTIALRVVALLAFLAGGIGDRLEAQTDSLKDTTVAKSDTIHVLPKQETIELPAEEERMAILGVGLLVLGGFVVLLTLKRRQADREAGIL